MEPSASPSAWQPITFGGVAAFERAALGRLILVQFLVASLVAGSVVWFVWLAWFPRVEEAIGRLPEKGAIRGAQLEWNAGSPAWLAEGSFLSILVDTDGASPVGQSADVQLEFKRDRLRIGSLFGHLSIRYPAGWIVGLNRAEAGPWWGAWRPFLLAGSGLAALCVTWASWVALATAYWIPVRVITFYSDRAATLAGCWRLAGAALLPGAFLMSGAIVLYGMHRLNLVGLLFAWLLHVVMGWVYAGIAPLRLPRLGGTVPRRGNPFGKARRKGNPFGG